MGDEIRLNEAWRRIVPIRRRSNGSAPSQGVCRGPPSRTSQAFSDRSQRPVDRGRAHRQQFATDLRREAKMTVPFHRFDKGSNAFSRSPQTRSDAFHSNMSALRSASS